MPLSKRKVNSADELSSAEDLPAKKVKTKSAAKGAAGGNQVSLEKDSDGNAFWELTGRRRVTISEFGGKTMVSIREYYEKDGKELPGKKGISLPMDQFSAVISLLPKIEKELKTKGIKIPRPEYGLDHDMDEALEDDDGETGNSKKAKENYEETSDEE